MPREITNKSKKYVISCTCMIQSQKTHFVYYNDKSLINGIQTPNKCMV
jgi:hypothetical protein